MTPKRGEGCPPARTLEAFAVGDARDALAHVSTCAACTASVEAVRAESSASLRQRPTELFLAQLDRRAATSPPRWRFWPHLAGALGVVAAAVVVFVVTNSTVDVTLKGGAFHVLRRTGTGSEALATGAQVKPGDVLGLGYDAQTNGFLFIAQLDGTEATAARFDGPVTAGPVTVPGAIELDAARGPEWFVAVFSSSRLDGPALLEQLAGQSQRPRLEVRCDGCQVSAVRLEKRP